MTTLHDFEATAIDGSRQSLAAYKGQVVLVVNTASACGFTPQFAGLQQLYDRYKDKGLAVVGFPCNQFGAQDPGSNDEIAQFCQRNYGVSFPMMAKVDVNGAGADPVFQWLTAEAPEKLSKDIEEALAA
jgi:glutathione peroxidase